MGVASERGTGKNIFAHVTEHGVTSMALWYGGTSELFIFIIIFSCDTLTSDNFFQNNFSQILECTQTCLFVKSEDLTLKYSLAWLCAGLSTSEYGVVSEMKTGSLGNG